MGTQLSKDIQPTFYHRLFTNKAFILLCGGQMVSTIGDIFFNLAVMWVIYAQSHSVFQTALIQVCWHLSSAIFSPLAGAWVDRYDRKQLLLITNLFSATIVGIVAVLIHIQGFAAPLVVFIAIFLLNSVGTLFGPALYSMMPEMVGPELMTTASGLFSSVKQTASLAGSFIAGIVMVEVGAAWAVGINALSFLFAAGAVALARLPVRTSQTTLLLSSKKRRSLFREVFEGWQAIADQPVIKNLIWLAVLINIATFLSPLLPALISQRLHGNALTFGIIQAASFFGSILGGILAGKLERFLGAGRLLALGLAFSGSLTLGIAFSTSLLVTASLEGLSAFSITVGSVAILSLLPLLVPEEYRGRLQGILGGMVVLAIPASSLLGGYLADLWGIVPLFAIGGAWLLGTAVLAWSNHHIPTSCATRCIIEQS